MKKALKIIKMVAACWY